MTIGKIVILKFLALFFLYSGLQAQVDFYTTAPLWRQALGGSVIGNPVAQVESVVVATDGGNLRAYSSQGTHLWDYFAGGRITPFISRSREGTSYIGRVNGILTAVNRSGRPIWRLNLGDPIVFPVLIGWDGRLFVFTDRRVVCMTAAGFVLWSRTFENRTVLRPVRDNAGGIILVKEDGEIIRLDPFGNMFSFMPEAGGIPVAAAPVEVEGRGHGILLLYENNRLELVFPASGSAEPGRIAETLGGGLLPAPPLAAVGRRNEAAVLLRDGRVALICVNDQRLLWTEASHIMPGELPNRPGQEDLDFFYDERGIYILTRTGATGFTSDGRRLWTIRLRGATSLPAFGDDGILYSGGAGWILYAYRLEDRARLTYFVHGGMLEGDYGTGNPGPSSWANYPFRFEERALEERFTEIRAAIRNGNVGAMEKEYVAWLMETAGSYIMSPRPVIQPPVFVRHRVMATSLLAYIGSRETIPFLANLFTRDPEPLVRSAAAEAIGRIGVDPDGHALRAFQNAIISPARTVDEALLIAIASATGALCRFSGPPLSDVGVRLLTVLMGNHRPSAVRNRAERELRSLVH